MNETLPNQLPSEPKVEQGGKHAEPPDSARELEKAGHLQVVKTDGEPHPDVINSQGHIEGHKQGPTPNELKVVQKIADEGNITSMTTWAAAETEHISDIRQHHESKGLFQQIREDLQRVFGFRGREIRYDEARVLKEVIEEQKQEQEKLAA